MKGCVVSVSVSAVGADAGVCMLSHEAESLDLGNVAGLGVIRAHALLGLPGVPLGLALRVEHAWALSVAVTDGGLLEEAVKLKLIFVGQSRNLVGNVIRAHSSGSVLERHL